MDPCYRCCLLLQDTVDLSAYRFLDAALYSSVYHYSTEGATPTASHDYYSMVDKTLCTHCGHLMHIDRWLMEGIACTSHTSSTHPTVTTCTSAQIEQTNTGLINDTNSIARGTSSTVAIADTRRDNARSACVTSENTDSVTTTRNRDSTAATSNATSAKVSKAEVATNKNVAAAADTGTDSDRAVEYRGLSHTFASFVSSLRIFLEDCKNALENDTAFQETVFEWMKQLQVETTADSTFREIYEGHASNLIATKGIERCEPEECTIRTSSPFTNCPTKVLNCKISMQNPQSKLFFMNPQSLEDGQFIKLPFPNCIQSKSYQWSLSIKKYVKLQILMFFVGEMVKLVHSNEFLLHFLLQHKCKHKSSPNMRLLCVLDCSRMCVPTSQDTVNPYKPKRMTTESTTSNYHLYGIRGISLVYKKVLIIGWYRKYSRNMSHSQWMIDGELKAEFSVEQMIGLPFQKLFDAQSYKFMSAGREDVDVRMLGGRPFLVELVDVRHSQQDWPKQLERETMISASTVADTNNLQNHKAYHLSFGTCELHNLQALRLLSSSPIPLDKLLFSEHQGVNEISDYVSMDIPQWSFAVSPKICYSALQSGAEEKKKSYDCLVYSSHSQSAQTVLKQAEQLQKYLPIKVKQTTPIRVLHRRTLDTRIKWVHKLELLWIHEHLFVAHVETQAGMYIKEFVHGDCGRTYPNLSMYFECELEVLALDVRNVTF